MRASLFFALAVAASAGPALAFNARIVGWEPIPEDDTIVTRSQFQSVFSAIPGPYVAFSAATGSLGFDDYQSTYTAGPDFALQSMRFVGGVTTVGGPLTIDFFDATQTLVNSTTLNLPSAGNFIWTITFESAAGLKDSNFIIPANGYVQLTAGAGTTGQWFLSTSLPTVGTESRAQGQGSVTTHSHRFELNIPAPGSLAILGLSGLALGRRRR